ncbi:MAG: DMT family transporter [Pseudomonadales bacterium]
MDTLSARLFNRHTAAIVVLLLTPALLSSNMVVARLVHDQIPPFTLAFTRWLAAIAVLLPFLYPTLRKHRQTLRAEWRQLLLLGVLGMGICGAFPYLGAQTTTSTNIGLIYAMSPVFIILFARWWYAQIMTVRQLLGVAVSLLGVIIVVAKGSLEVLQQLAFTRGDLWILAASASWGFYSLWQGHLKTKLTLFPRFFAMSVGGVLGLLPFALWEIQANWQHLSSPQTMQTLGLTVAFLALISSIAAYAAYAYIQKVLGASKASLVMYAIPLYNAGMSWLVLGETLQMFHLIAAALILPGLFLAVTTRK